MGYYDQRLVPASEAIPLVEHAYEIFDGIPAEKINLKAWVHVKENGEFIEADPILRHPCRTIACAGGWIIQHPDFSDGGTWVRRNTDPRWQDWAFQIGDATVYIINHLREKLGLTVEEAETLFDARRAGERGNDKAIWQKRCKRLLEKLHKEAGHEA